MYVKKNKHDLYKGSYFFAFYDKTDEYLVYTFNNVREILEHLNKPINRTNVNLIDNEIYRALKTETHFTRFMNGQILRVYIIKNYKGE